MTALAAHDLPEAIGRGVERDRARPAEAPRPVATRLRGGPPGAGR
jgi:hypothetical protein